jgi:predicted NAD/FAD-binding protein
VKPRLAIVGTGIAGLGCAYFLADRYNITLLEKNATLGGHTNTVDIPYSGGTFPMDTGFMVFNKITYPNLLRFFETLSIAYEPTEMSFSVQYRPLDLEWNGAGLNKIFGQRKNLVNPRFWQMLKSLTRFNQEAVPALESGEYDELSIEEYAEARGYGEDFLAFFLIPMSSAIWSTDPQRMRAFPIRTLLRFFYNHGFLGLDTHHQWYTVTGGSRCYIERLMTQLDVQVHLNRTVVAVEESEACGVTLSFENGESEHFEKVILACHADQSLSMLVSPTPMQQQLLAPFRYEKNLATLHTDAAVMPKTRRCWGSWNYRIHQDASQKLVASTHYWMNNLQRLPDSRPHFVSLNAEDWIDPSTVIQQIPYEHPGFDLPAIRAQKSLPELNQETPTQRILFCGSYFRYGFHEDAFSSALALCRTLTGETLWQ